jgi:hypothetical protein
LRYPPPEKAPTESTEKICECANIFTGLRGINFLWGGTIDAILLVPAVIMPLRNLAKRCKRFTPLLAAPAALLLIQGEAKAILTYNIFESAGNVVVQTSGSLDLTGATSISLGPLCGVDGALASAFAIVCTGPDIPVLIFGITGPSSFNGSAFILPASSVSGLTTVLWGGFNAFSISPSFISNTSINSNAAFNGTNLAGLGFATTGLIGTWTLDGTSESIQVIFGAPTPS